LGIDSREKIVGNINFIYPPKIFLGQSVGLKCHEHVIDAIGIVLRSRSDVVGVLIGGTFGTANTLYEERLRARALKIGNGKILMPGQFSSEEVKQSWADFDCAVHVPLSENCGGVVEPLMAGVPTIAGLVGGLPEVVMNRTTGLTVPLRNPQALASKILTVLENPEPCHRMAARGRRLVTEMFNVARTGREVAEIYRHILERSATPKMFSPEAFLDAIEADEKQATI
jgi:glycosyltransferase involved in cell wall biosynthesis